MSRLAEMLAKSKSPTTALRTKDVLAGEGMGLTGMTAKIAPVNSRDVLAGEGMGGLSNMTSTLQPRSGGSSTPSGESSKIQTT